ncbi:MAG: hypothetical protein SFZ02_17880 [bacterium]|nr:hypothetical protein [bacterium]
MDELKEYIIEVFPKMRDGRWGMATGHHMTEADKAQCSNWTLKIKPYSGNNQVIVNVYFHGDLPSTDEQFWINKQVAEFCYGYVVREN